jgi:hypothetical protein
VHARQVRATIIEPIDEHLIDAALDLDDKQLRLDVGRLLILRGSPSAPSVSTLCPSEVQPQSLVAQGAEQSTERLRPLIDSDGDTDAGLCMIDGSENPYRICLKQLCCAQLEDCDVELGCFCLLDCLTESDVVTCAMTCTPGVVYFRLVQCQAMSCASVCQ